MIVKDKTVTGKVRVSYQKKGREQIPSSYTTINFLSITLCIYRFFLQGHCTSNTFNQASITREQFRTQVLKDYSTARESTHTRAHIGTMPSCSVTMLFDISVLFYSSKSILTFYYLAWVSLLGYVTGN